MGNKSKRAREKARSTPRPKPDTLKIEGNWQTAIKQSLTKKKPAKDWPK